MKKILTLGCLVLLGLSFSHVAEARIDYHGFYFTQTASNAYIAELKDVNNSIRVSFDHIDDPTPQTLADNIRANNYKAISLSLAFNEALFNNTNNARITYLAQVKKRISVDSDFIRSVAFIHIDEEEYTLLDQGKFNTWAVFQGKDNIAKRAILKSGLESYINDVHNTFPGIPVVIVENYWGGTPYIPAAANPAFHTPPSNLDVLGLDAYYIPTSSLCDATQKGIFDNALAPVSWAVTEFNRPIYMVGATFADGFYKMPTACQAEWYIDLANATSKVIGLDWFLYTDFPGISGARNSNIMNFLRQQGVKILASANPKTPDASLLANVNFAPTPNPTPAPTPAPSPSPAPVSSCLTPDPFVSIGGGVCVSGGWTPKGNTVSVPAPTPTPSPSPTPTPVPVNTCITADPFKFLGGGLCRNGGWLPPGLF